MSSHDKALDKAKKHSHKKSADGKCTVCDLVMGNEGKVNEKGKRPVSEFGAKNNDSEED